MSRNCLNCSKALSEEENYCSHCGQTAHTHRLNLHHIWHDLVHAFTHTDKTILSLIFQLTYRPGHLAREYVEGKRTKYFNPFSFLFLVVGVASLVFISTGFIHEVGSQRVSNNPITQFINRRVNLMILLNVPLVAFFNWMLFRKSGRNYAENLVLAAYLSGERSVFFTLVVGPLWYFLHTGYYVILISYILAWFLFCAMATAQFYGGNRKWAFVKGFLAAVFTQLTTILLVSLAFFVYFALFYKKG
jgi:Protein of unknown function (DUF3667)